MLVFDEATSALDNATEQSVMEAVEGLNRDLTMVMIAHRLITVANCDRIVQPKAWRFLKGRNFGEFSSRVIRKFKGNHLKKLNYLFAFANSSFFVFTAGTSSFD